MLRQILALLLISTPAFAEMPRDCDITIEFNSYTSEIDAKTYETIMNRVIATKDITEKHVMNIGREGERTLCLNLAETADMDAIYEDLKSLIPAEAKTGWEKITSRTGSEFQTKKTSVYTPYNWEEN